MPLAAAPVSAPWQPPLRWWSHVWRYLACLALGAVTWLPVMEAQAEDRPLLFWLDLLFCVVAAILVAFRRRWPMTIAVLCCLLTPLTSSGAGFILLASVSLATQRRWWQILPIGLLSVAMTGVYYRIQPTTDPSPAWLVALFTVLLVAASLAWGMFIGSRRELVWTLRDRAATAEAERDRRAAQARAGERTRIAREMHDVLAHRISQISMHAGALTYRDDLDADEMRASLAVIQSKAHEALSDLREVLGVLREDQGALTGPQPTLADLPALVAEARAAGASIEYDDALAPAVGDPATTAPPEQVGRTVFRIVQEGITNAAKHAPAATLRISVSGDTDDGIEIVLCNALGFGPTRTPGAGLGLVGLAERAELRGGWLRHQVIPAGAGQGARFELRAWLPWAS